MGLPVWISQHSGREAGSDPYSHLRRSFKLSGTTRTGDFALISDIQPPL